MATTPNRSWHLSVGYPHQVLGLSPTPPLQGPCTPNPQSSHPVQLGTLRPIRYFLSSLYSKGGEALCLHLYLNAHMCRYACLFASVHACEWVYLYVRMSIYMHVYVNLYNSSIGTMLSILHTISLILEVDNSVSRYYPLRRIHFPQHSTQLIQGKAMY